MVWVALLSLVVACWLLWQRGEATLRLAGSELRGGLTAELEGIHGGQSEMVRLGRLRQATQDGPNSLAAAEVSISLSGYLQTHPAVGAIWLLDDAANLVTGQRGPLASPEPYGLPSAPTTELPDEVRAAAQAAMVAGRLQTGWRRYAGRREFLLAQPVRFNGSRQIDGAVVSAVSIDALMQPLLSGLEPSMRADLLITDEGERQALRPGVRAVTWPVMLRSSTQGHSHALQLRVSQSVWATFWPGLWLAGAYVAVGTLLVAVVRRRVQAQAQRAVQPLQALRDAAAQVAEHGRAEIPAISVQSLLDGGSEVQDLAACFANMLERLFKAQALLEQTVHERTAELLQQKATLQQVLGSVNEVIFQIDAEGRWAYLNPAWERITGHSAEASLGRHFLDTMHPADQASASELFVAMQRGELDEVQHEGRFRSPTGSERWLAAHVRLQRDADGRPTGCSGTLTDVSERRAMEADLRLRNRAIDASYNGIVLVDVRGPHPTVVFTNEGFTRMSGYLSEEVVGRSLSFLQGPERDQPGSRTIRSALAAGEPCRVLMGNYRKDGQRYDNDLSIAPVHDERTGEVTHYIGVSSDVTERLMAERLLHDQFARLDTIFALSPDGFVSFDGQGRPVSINPAFERLTGLSRCDLIGLDGRQFDARLAERVIERNPPGLAQWRPEHSDAPADAAITTDVLVLRGPPRRVTVCSRRDCDAPNVSCVLQLRDITRETEVDRMKSEFLSTAAHELRTPMASIRGFSDLLMMRKFDEERTRDLLQTINRQSIWLTDMINELLDLARIEARKGNDFRLEVVALQDTVTAAIETLLVPGDARRVVQQGLPPGADTLPLVRIDRQKIRQALTNVLSNAYKYSPGGGTIELTLRQREQGGNAQVGIAVRDEGIGMSPEHAKRAFERFFRADASGNIPGTGLGLALVKEIVELHGGQVELLSHLGEGTTVTMWLPAWAVQAQPPAEPAEPTERVEAAEG
jgi:PAS domain S-box-containing protein